MAAFVAFETGACRRLPVKVALPIWRDGTIGVDGEVATGHTDVVQSQCLAIGQRDVARSRVRQRHVPVERVRLIQREDAAFVALKLASKMPTVSVVFDDCVMFPAAVTVRLPTATLLVPSTNALLLVSVTSLFAPVFVIATAPLKALAWSSVMIPFAGVLKRDVPPTVSVVLATWVMFPVFVITRLPVTTLTLPSDSCCRCSSA